jgi:protein SCO1/2
MTDVRVVKALTGLAVMAAVGCHGAGGGASAVAKAKQYPVRGVVESLDVAQQEIALKTQEIPGYMAPMTMTYKVTDPAAMQEMHPGDMIVATLDVNDDPQGPEDMKLEGIDVVGQAQPDYAPKVQYHVPAAGDVVPDFMLLNQSAKMIGLSKFRGKVLVMTFIYTRCPLSDYCPRMSRNFAELDRDLAAYPKLYAATHLLSVSFDPRYDTPAVLKSYGGAYTGKYVKETFQHWDFAAAPVKVLPQMEQWFDVGVTPGQNGTLQHSLSTVVVGKDGKVVAFWPTNDWTVDEVLAKVKAAVQ